MIVTQPNVAHTMVFKRYDILNLVRGERNMKIMALHTIPYKFVNDTKKNQVNL